MGPLVAGHEPSGGRDDPPPGVPLAAVGQEPPDGSSRPGVASLLRHLAVGDDVARSQPGEHPGDGLLELGHNLANLATTPILRAIPGRSAGKRTQNERGMGTPGDELVEVLDESGKVVDVVTRAEMRARNLRHRSVYIAVVVGERVLTHQRAAWKDVWPDHWDLAFGGVCGVGETWPDAARRELAEEAGIVVSEAELLDLGDGRYESDEVTVVGRVYAVAHDGPFTFADGEVNAIEWVALAELERWLADHDACSDSVEIVAPRLR